MREFKFSVIAAFAAAMALSGCATTGTGTQGPLASSDNVAAVAPGPERDLTPQEKKAIVDAVAPSLRDPNSAKYRWAKFPVVVTDDSVNYCSVVDAKSPFAAYDGKQAYIIEAKVVGNHVTSAVMGLIAGGKDAAIVAKMCAKYGLDPNKSS